MIDHRKKKKEKKKWTARWASDPRRASLSRSRSGAALRSAIPRCRPRPNGWTWTRASRGCRVSRPTWRPYWRCTLIAAAAAASPSPSLRSSTRRSSAGQRTWMGFEGSSQEQRRWSGMYTRLLRGSVMPTKSSLVLSSLSVHERERGGRHKPADQSQRRAETEKVGAWIYTHARTHPENNNTGRREGERTSRTKTNKHAYKKSKCICRLDYTPLFLRSPLDTHDTTRAEHSYLD